MSPFYIPLFLAVGAVLITVLILAFCSRPLLTIPAFRRAWMLWLILVLCGGFATSIASYQHVLSIQRSGDEACAFLLISLFLGVLLPAYAGFGFCAWFAPNAWQRIIQRRDQVLEQRRQALTRTR